jgi:glycosyltransferase involved in cell wall biosynthesis
MKIAFVIPPMLVGGRPFDFPNLWDSPRGLTGSEIQMIVTAKEMALRGHVCSLFVEPLNAAHYEGVALRPYSDLREAASAFDVVCVGLDVNALAGLSSQPLRVVWQQCNDFDYGAPGFDSNVDLYVVPSESQRQMFIRVKAPIDTQKLRVVPNGVYPHPPRDPAPGRVVYIPSPYRGLHLLLQEWPAIRRAVPHATLKIFYHSLASWISLWTSYSDAQLAGNALWRENKARALYTQRALPALAAHGVEVVGSVSRNRMAFELSRAEVLAYPCDPIAWTESFCCSALEGCAAGALPVLSEADCLKEIFGEACPMVPAPARKHLGEWRGLVVRALTDTPWADEWRAKGRALAGRLTWQHNAEAFEGVLNKALAERT